MLGFLIRQNTKKKLSVRIDASKNAISVLSIQDSLVQKHLK